MENPQVVAGQTPQISRFARNDKSVEFFNSPRKPGQFLGKNSEGSAKIADKNII
jgi:hypothetical protein